LPKILRILNRLNVGGPTYNVAYLSAYLSSDFTTRVLAGHHESDEASSAYILDGLGVDYTYVPNMYRSIHPYKDWQAFQYISKAMRAFQPDIVHTHAAKAGVLGRPAAYWQQKRPIILHTYHGNVFDGYFSPAKTKLILAVEKYCCGLSDAIVAISEKQKIDLVEKYRIAPAEKVHVVPLGFDLHRFTIDRAHKRAAFRYEWQVSAETLLITIVGRFAPVKNHAVFLDTFLALRQRYPNLPIAACMVGDGELAGPLLQKAKDAGLRVATPEKPVAGADLIFTSWRKDMDAVHAATDIAILTSLNEGTPVSLIEAMASGKPVVSTDVGGVADVVQSGITGLLAGASPLALAEAVSSLIQDAELSTTLAANAEQFVLENYAYDTLCRNMQTLYRQLLNKK
jgi:glycosyltransferase involved in cell wall biosynthesis